MTTITSHHRTSPFVFTLVILFLVMITSLACGFNTILPTAATAPSTSEPSAESTTSQVTPVQENTLQAIETPTSPTAQAGQLKVLAMGFGQNQKTLAYAFILENPNFGNAIQLLDYEVIIYDAQGTVIETVPKYLDFIFPQQRLGVANTVELAEGATAAKVEIKLGNGRQRKTNFTGADSLTADKVAYYPDKEGVNSMVMGVVNNPFDLDLEKVRVSAVIYNKSGQIIGGGYAWMDFIPAKKSAGVEMYVTSAGEIGKIELYPAITTISAEEAGENAIPDGAKKITIIKQGFGQHLDGFADFGLVIQNPNKNFAVKESEFHVTSYAEDGNVAGVLEGNLAMVWPGETLGLGGSFFVTEGVKVTRTEIHFKTGRFEASEATPPFTVENIAFNKEVDDQFLVTGEIVNSSSQQITGVQVSAIPYNQAGEIIGGGFSLEEYVIPANGRVPVQVILGKIEYPAKIELFGVTTLSSEYK